MVFQKINSLKLFQFSIKFPLLAFVRLKQCYTLDRNLQKLHITSWISSAGKSVDIIYAKPLAEICKSPNYYSPKTLMYKCDTSYVFQ